MAMSEAHKAALAKGRNEARAIRKYLEALDAKSRGRTSSPEALKKRIEKLQSRIETEANPLARVDLIQQRLDAERDLVEAGSRSSVDLAELEAGFVEHARDYSERKRIKYAAWREQGIQAEVLRKAGIKRTRG